MLQKLQRHGGLCAGRHARSQRPWHRLYENVTITNKRVSQVEMARRALGEGKSPREACLEVVREAVRVREAKDNVRPPLASRAFPSRGRLDRLL